MYEITKDNYKSIDFDGVIISVPREHLKDKLRQDFCLHFECAYYTEGRHGYKECGHNPDKSSFFSAWYGDEDMPNGFGFNSTSRLPWDEKYLHFNNVRYYKFKDMEEFCSWYLQQKGFELWTTGGDLKGKLNEIIPESLEVVNDKYEQLRKLNTECIYWDFYRDEETTPKMREKIEQVYPHFREQYTKSIKQYNGQELKDIYTEDEIKEKVNPGWKTRRQKYGELITLMDLYWNWVKECMKPGATVHDVEPAHTKLEKFLDSEANDYFG